MRILFLTQFFEPERTTKGLLFARALADRGHDVEVLTGIPNYPGGRIFPGYSLSWRVQTEMMDGIRVRRVPLYPSHDRSALKRVANYVSFAVSAVVKSRALRREKFDLIYAYWPPATIGIPAVVLSARLRVPFVLEIQDMWPDTVAASGMLTTGTLIRAISRYCSWVYRHAAAVTVISNGFRDALIERGVPAGRVHVIHNWCDPHAAQRAPRDPDLADRLGIPADRFVVLFAGTMGTAQGLATVLEAARLSESAMPEVQFVFVGGGVERERLQQLGAPLRNVTFLPIQPANRMPPILALGDALLVHLRDEPLFALTIPAKTQSSLASGRPVIMAVRGDAAELVERSGGGVTCAPEDAPALVRAVRVLADMSPEERQRMGERGVEYYQRFLSLDAGVSQFEAVFESVASREEAARQPRATWSLTLRLGVKRALDVVGAMAALIIFSPILLAVAVGVRVTMGAPVFFSQVRPGLNGRPFRLVKFRTMRDAVDADGRPLADGARLTAFGRWMRRLSLDELPELWNVVKGDMSLVGPRPLLMRYTAFFTGRERLRLTMRPGITGMAQIQGRNEIEWTRRLALDADYVEGWTLRKDVRILAGTIAAVVSARGAVPDANTIMLDLDQERASSRGSS